MSNRHRESNTFRFRSFNERVQGVRVSAAHRLKSDRAVRLAADGKNLTLNFNEKNDKKNYIK